MNIQFEDKDFVMIRIMETKNENIRPFMAVHPGSILRDELEARGIAFADFAHDLGISAEVMESILDEKKDIDSSIASAIERELGISASFWMALQNEYYQDCAYLDKKKKSKSHAVFGKLPWNKVAL